MNLHPATLSTFASLPPVTSRNAKGRPVRLRAIALYAALVFTGGLTHASSLGLEDALRVAVSEHPSVAARQSELRAALMKLDLAERQKYPGLVAQSAKDGAGKQVTTLRIEQPLWTGGRITGEIDAAQAGIQQAEAGVLQSQLDIMLKVVAGFTELGRIQSRQLAARSNVEEHARLDNMIQRRVESKVSPTSDSIQANSRLAQARAELNQLEALAIRARSTLSQATGNPVTDIVVPKQRDMDEYPLETLVSTAQDFSPALRKLDGEHAATTAEMAVRRSGAYPQFKMRLDRTFGGAGAGTNAYLALDVQTGAGFATIASVKEAEARRDAIQSQMEVARRETIDAVSADWADLKSYRMQARDLKSQVDSTTAVFDSFVRQYAVGRKGWNDVLNAQREVTQARYQLADADWGTLRSALRLQLLTGLLTAENISLILVDPNTPVAADVKPAATADVMPAAAAANTAPATTVDVTPAAGAADTAPAATVDVTPAATNSGGTEPSAQQTPAHVAAGSVESTR